MPKKYIVRLSNEERETCGQVIRKLTGTSEKVRHAQVLVKADVDGPAWTDQKIAEAFSCRTITVEKFRHSKRRRAEKLTNFQRLKTATLIKVVVASAADWLWAEGLRTEDG